MHSTSLLPSRNASGTLKKFKKYTTWSREKEKASPCFKCSKYLLVTNDSPS